MADNARLRVLMSPAFHTANPYTLLLARHLTGAGVELKCRRCKRVVLLPVPPDDGAWIEVTLR